MILHVPADNAVTTPVPGLTNATPALLLLHAPDPPPSTTEFAVYVGVAPMQTGLVPETEAMLAFGLTVIACSADFTPLQPPDIV